MNTPTVRSTLPAAILLAITGWLGLVYLVVNTLPTLGPRWLFFFFTVLAVSGISLPLVTFLNRRFPTQPAAGRSIIVREAALVGIFFATMAWFQLGRVLTWGLGLLLAAGLILVEFLIRLREKSRWDPGTDSQ